MIYRDSISDQKWYQFHKQENEDYQEYPYVSKHAFLNANGIRYVGRVSGFGYKYSSGIDLNLTIFPCKEGVKLSVSADIHRCSNQILGGQCMEELKELVDNHYFVSSYYNDDYKRYEPEVMKDEFYMLYNLWKKYHLGAVFPKEMFLDNELYQNIGFDDCKITENDTHIFRQVDKKTKEVAKEPSPYKCEKSIIDFNDLVLLAHFVTSEGKEILEPGEKIPYKWKIDTLKALNNLYAFHFEIQSEDKQKEMLDTVIQEIKNTKFVKEYVDNLYYQIVNGKIYIFYTDSVYSKRLKNLCDNDEKQLREERDRHYDYLSEAKQIVFNLDIPCEFEETPYFLENRKPLTKVYSTTGEIEEDFEKE